MRGNIINGADAARIGLGGTMLSRLNQVMTKARELAQELGRRANLADPTEKLAVNKWLKHQANLIMDAGLAYEAMMLEGSLITQQALRAASETPQTGFRPRQGSSLCRRARRRWRRTRVAPGRTWRAQCESRLCQPRAASCPDRLHRKL